MHGISDDEDRVAPASMMMGRGISTKNGVDNRARISARPKSTGLHKVSEMHVCIRGRL